MVEIRGVIVLLSFVWTVLLAEAFIGCAPQRRRKPYDSYYFASTSSNEEENGQGPPKFPFDLNHASSIAKETLESKANEGVQSVQDLASTLSDLEQSGRYVVESAAGAAWSGVNQLASEGTSSVQSAAQAAGSGIIGLANTAASTAESAGSGLVGLAQQGTSQATNLVQWLDTQAKDGAAATNAKAQEMILGFTGKSQYQFGDITKEILRRATSTNVDIRDVMLLLKVMLTLGATIAPLAKVLPVTVLLEMLNVSLETRLGGKILETLAGAIDERLLAAFGADELGDVAKRSLTIGIAAFTGKATYQQGDIEQAVKERARGMPPDDHQSSSSSTVVKHPTLPQPRPITLNLMVGPEFAEWDQSYRKETTGTTDLDTIVAESLNSGSGMNRISSEQVDREFITELDEWDQRFRTFYSDKQSR